MKPCIRICNCLLLAASLVVWASQFANGADAAQLSGSYHVVRKTDLGPQTGVQLQLHFTNRGPSELHIQRVTLWDLPHPEKGATQACSVVVHAGASVEVTQEFTVPRAEYELWKRGARPRLVLEIAGPGGRPTNRVVRLDRISEKGN